MYIEPSRQLPERAESLHPVDPSEVFRELGKAFALIGNAFLDGIGTVFTTVISSIQEEIEEATRDNAYHPQGPVIRSTAFELPDDMPACDQRLLK